MRFRPRLIDLPGPNLLAAIAQVQPDKPNQLVVLSGGCCLFQEWDGHELLLWHGSARLFRRRYALAERPVFRRPWSVRRAP